MADSGARSGTVIGGKWRVEHLLGQGGMADVYAATHRNGKRAALKILHRELIEKAGTLRRFRREGYVANRVGHPAVVVVDDDDVCEDGAPYLVMELLEGATLESLREKAGGKLPLSQVLCLGETLMDVMAAAHRRGIVHRDVKPSNLFLTRSGSLKVLDFGIARIGDRSKPGETTVECCLGTPAYMSPEQARGRWELVDARSDIYSVGATLFTLFTGRPVHEALTRNEQLGLAMTAEAPSLVGRVPELPDRFARIVDRALRYAPEERWPDAESMHREWLNALHGEPSAEAATLLRARSARSKPSRWLAITAIFMAVLATCASIGNTTERIRLSVSTRAAVKPVLALAKTKLASPAGAPRPLPTLARISAPNTLGMPHRVPPSAHVKRHPAQALVRALPADVMALRATSEVRTAAATQGAADTIDGQLDRRR